MTAVVVTGVGVVSPYGWGADPFWSRLVAGESALAPLRRCAAAAGRLAGEVPARAVGEVAQSPAGRRMDWASLMALGACRLALADAGIVPADLPAERTSLALGSAYGNLQETATFLDRLFARGAGNPLLFPNMVFNAPLSYASIELGVRGETTMLSMREVSGEAAIGWGGDVVEGGRASVCLAGGVDELGEVLHRVLEDGRALASGPPRPFDRAADGSVVGEGAGVLVLESVDGARARGARLRVRLVETSAFTVPAPAHGWPSDPGPLAAGLAPALEGAGAVVAGASGDRAHDAVLGEALARCPRAPVTTIRGAIGDFGAAGALAAAAAVRALETGTIPPALGAVSVRPGLDVVTGTARRAPLESVVVVGLGRGGLVRTLRFAVA